MNILVVGAGGAGGYFAARWAEIGHDVTVVARGQQLRAIQASGITLRTPSGDAVVPVRAVERADDTMEPFDFVLFATKTWQLPDALPLAAPAVGPDTALLGVQNGVDSVAVIAKAFPAANVLGGTCHIISMLEGPGIIRHASLLPTITFGELSGGISPRITELVDQLSVPDLVRMIASENVQVDLWRKFLFFAAASSVGSVTRSPMNVLRAMPASRALLESAVQEVYTMARAYDVALPPESVADTLAFIDAIPAGGTSSTQRDVIAGRPSELDALAGSMVRLGRERGVPTPVYDVLYGALVPQEAKARGTVDW